jgi:hypothetical protein
MKQHKICVVLLALLLAAMAMVPMVSAAEEEKGSLAPALDIRNIQLPELQFDSTQTKVLVTTEFRLDPDLFSSYRAAVKESSELADAKIPYGSIIYHSDDGVTTVFDAAGRQLFSADDKRAAKVKTSKKDKPATYFHEVPSGSMILSNPESPDTTYVVDTNNKLVLTVIDKSRNSDIVQDSRALMATQNTVQCNPAGRCTGWFEYAEDDYIPELTRFEAYWATPSRPLTSNMGEKIAIFNSVQPSGNAFILQPVLEWNVNSNNYAWTAAPWYYRSTSDSYYGRRITGVQTNDVIKGSMYYSTVNGYPGWWVSIKKNSDPESSIFVTQLSTKTGLNAEVVLEATGLGIDSNNDLPGDVRFYNMIYQKTGGSAASVSLTGYVDPGTSPRFSGLSAVVEQNPSQVKLWTPN